jgi:hypothetical protein
MAGVDDYEFQSSGGDNSWKPPESSSRRAALVVGAVVLVLIAGYLYYSRPSAPKQAGNEAPATPAAKPAAPADDFEHLNLPALDESDALVRERVGALSSHQLVKTWLATSGLIRNFVVVIENISHGMNPSSHLRVLKPAGTFKVTMRGAQTVIDPQNYDRFSRIAEAAGSIDARAAGRLFNSFKPLLQMAYDELGNQEPIDRAVERAIGVLTTVPVVDRDIAVERTGEGIGYRYVDPKLEDLNGAQKQLLRMGPKNVRVIQEQLRQFANGAHLTVAP